MLYSDLQLKNATEVAYKNFQYPFEQLVDDNKQPPFTISELCEQMGKDINELFPDLDGMDISDWKIVDYYDTNSDTGFYGCVIDVGGGDAIVTFRGSEGATDLSNLKNDWIKADLGTVNSTLTNQQAEVEKFLKQISKSDYINNYDSLGLTGHSLGGNLAIHGTIISAKSEIGLSDKIERCVSFDGPGYSDEYIKFYHKYIDKVSGKITHYKWSPVGGMLFELPGVQRISLKFTEKNDLLYKLITRHSTESIEFAGENAIRGEETTWDILTSKFSQGIDHLPNIVGDTLIITVSSLLYGGIWMYNEMFKDGEITPFGVTVIASAATFVAMVGPIKTVELVFCIVFAVVATFFVAVAYEYVYEFIEYIVNVAVESIIIFCDWLKDKVDELKDYVAKSLNYIQNWFNNNFNNGYKYSINNPQIKLDTFKLKNYASRIYAVNSRISKIDRRMDSLYWRVGLLDLWNLIQADLMTKYSWRLLRVASYLNETASDFEKIENEIINSL